MCIHFTDGHAACQRLSILSLIAPLAVTDVAYVGGHAVSMLCVLITRTTQYCHFSTVANVFQHCTTVIFMLIHFHHYNRYVCTYTHTHIHAYTHTYTNTWGWRPMFHLTHSPTLCMVCLHTLYGMLHASAASHRAVGVAVYMCMYILID